MNGISCNAFLSLLTFHEIQHIAVNLLCDELLHLFYRLTTGFYSIDGRTKAEMALEKDSKSDINNCQTRHHNTCDDKNPLFVCGFSCCIVLRQILFFFFHNFSSHSFVAYSKRRINMRLFSAKPYSIIGRKRALSTICGNRNICVMNLF